jgi:hypothetical protein
VYKTSCGEFIFHMLTQVLLLLDTWQEHQGCYFHIRLITRAYFKCWYDENDPLAVSLDLMTMAVYLYCIYVMIDFNFFFHYIYFLGYYLDLSRLNLHLYWHVSWIGLDILDSLYFLYIIVVCVDYGFHLPISHLF